MINYTAIVLAAGQGKRMQTGQNKQFLMINELPLIIHTVTVFVQDSWCSEIILVTNKQEYSQMKEVLQQHGLEEQITLAGGGLERQDSVYEGLQTVRLTDQPVFIHDGARPFVKREHLHQLAEVVRERKAGLLAVPVTDTIKQKQQDRLTTLDRHSLWAAQTPQAFDYSLILSAHEKARSQHYYGTDDASLVERLGGEVVVVEGSYDNMKLTTPEDLAKAQTYAAKDRKVVNDSMIRIGQGFDVHQFAEGRKCIVGGVEIPHEQGLLGHSDADVLLHTIADACLGAIGEGDIGRHFPDTDHAYKDADSRILLQRVWEFVTKQGYELGNLDCTVIAQAPKMAPYVEQIQQNIAELLNSEPARVNVKATTTEKLGFTGRKEGMAAQAVVLLQK
ncbi:bifunctional 2-C-methyl-D-erythritol 4-phosphate cytidylyltransferase/2-C-methyl-D-erythritol 2,4-cyclodiphosphate synthase [Halobacillus sp. A5]|uniref:bifunctional 2-C-methyl-D-erythritol 4-phosphate cytidylyltransferase/2-C-methyl-D-erythritol 2,4-cyclodiphosphate synthase n=1 Tax=Halobacillus sp. A5 TaxID=2880263 RepID=UPI002111D3BC|nr:bifunctional 2-C-methyl-D-erythritol 4-phosphate cytidylyltransferase/2-C-methyl-D-erythritol 2,4-cyclodiphosphate synthase [Halobacillus sp. A5]MCP3029540.1 bifunctional 2-C-methyl-D-erythritol 4-phosphate cytidylyltransferase/2-C-methyl-D-erythritol 2,4-cyclodiphosphate synthase [Halobacillus sp. A5]